MIPSGEETTILSTLIKQKIIKKESLDSKLEDSQTKLFDKYKEKGLINEKSNYIFTDKTLDNFFYIQIIKKIFQQAKKAYFFVLLKFRGTVEQHLLNL